jgi:hypothetical protein
VLLLMLPFIALGIVGAFAIGGFFTGAAIASALGKWLELSK